MKPAGDTGDLIALGRLGGNRDLPSQSVSSLKQSDIVTALSGYPCCLHTAGAAAHHDDFAFGALCFLNDVRQAHVLSGRRGVLNAQYVQALVLAVDAVVSAHTLFDLIDLAHLDLGDQVRVGNMCPGHTHQVYIAPFEDTLGLIGILNVLGVDHRHVHHFLDPRRQV